LIPTADRPETAAAAVEAYANEIRERGRETRILVLDDSSHDSATSTVRERCEAIARASGVSTHVIDTAARRDYAADVALAANRTGARPEALEAALGIGRLQGQPAYGANRNLGLLMCAGGAYVSADDDTSPAFVSLAPSTSMSSPDVSIRSDTEFIGLTPFTSWPQLEGSVTPFRGDVFSVIERFLGRSIADLSGPGQSESIDVDARAAPLLGRLERHPEAGRVRIACTGLYGDSAMSNPPHHLFRAHREQRTQNVEIRSRYDSLKASRLVLRGSPIPTITDVPFLMGTFYALDTSSILPPFLPVGRREDAFFAFLTHLVYPESLICHLPIAVRHEPVEERRGWTVDITDAHVAPVDLLQALILEQAGSGLSGCPPERLRFLGGVLVDLGQLDEDAFERRVALAAKAFLARVASSVEAHLEWYGRQPRYWALDAERYLAGVDRMIESGETGSTSGDDTPLLRRDVCAQYGELLLSWPEIWNAAHEVNDRWMS
jgi:hypothetical protein